MEEKKALEALRGRLGVSEARDRIARAGPVGALIVPAVNGIVAFPGEPHLLGPTSALCGAAPFQFSQAFKQIAGIGFHEFADRVRVDQALVRLAETDQTVEEIAQEFGFMGATTLGLSIAEYTGLPLVAVLSLLRPDHI